MPPLSLSYHISFHEHVSHSREKLMRTLISKRKQSRLGTRSQQVMPTGLWFVWISCLTCCCYWQGSEGKSTSFTLYELCSDERPQEGQLMRLQNIWVILFLIPSDRDAKVCSVGPPLVGVMMQTDSAANFIVHHWNNTGIQVYYATPSGIIFPGCFSPIQLVGMKRNIILAGIDCPREWKWCRVIPPWGSTGSTEERRRTR